MTIRKLRIPTIGLTAVSSLAVIATTAAQAAPPSTIIAQ